MKLRRCKRVVAAEEEYNLDDFDSDYFDSDDFELDDADQEYDSAATSINSKKLPAIYHMVDFEPGKLYLDFGGGKFDNAIMYLKDKGCELLVYDKFNRTKEYNQEVIQRVRDNRGADGVISSNVLNVIKEPDARIAVLKNMKKLAKPGADMYITVYEGTGKGDEGPTKSGYQLNRKTKDYMDEIQSVFPDAKRKGKLVIAHNTGAAANSSTSIDASQYTDTQTMKYGSKEYMIHYTDTSNIPYDDEEALIYSLQMQISVISPYDDATYAWAKYENGTIYFIKDGKQIDSVVIGTPSDSGVDFNEYAENVAYTAMENLDYLNKDVEKQMIYNSTDIKADSKYWLDPPEDTRDADEISTVCYIEISVDTNIIIDDEGGWAYEDDDLSFADGPDGTSYYEDSCSHLYLDDVDGCVDKLNDLMESKLPLDEGKYHISGNLTLAYDVECERWSDRGDDEYRYNTDFAEVSFNKKKSSLDNFKWQKI